MTAARGDRRAKRAVRAGQVFVISAPSGGGKTTVVKRLQRLLPRLVRSISVTTRPPRQGERAERAYRFVSLPTFQRFQREGALLEWAKVHGAYYGTPKRPILEALARGRDVILSIDVQGARQIRRALGQRALLIFLLPPSMAQLRRRLLRRRTEAPEAVHRRLTAAAQELACASWYDTTVVNDRLEHAVRVVRDLIQSHASPATPSRGWARRRPARGGTQRKGFA